MAIKTGASKMTLSQYLRSKGHKLTVRRLAELSLYSESGLWRMYKRDPSTIDELLEQYMEKLNKPLETKE